MASLKDLFIVDAGTFQATAFFVDAEAKNEFVTDFKAGQPRKQEVKDGVPVWRVTVHLEGYGAIALSIALPEKPAFEAFTKVVIENMRIGRGPKAFWGNAEYITADLGL